MCLLLVVLTLGIYWPVMSHEFVDYDDGDYMVANTQVQRGLTWAGVKWAFVTGHASNWHPLTWLSHMLDVSVFGKTPGGHHFTNVLFHCANVVLVFLLWQTLTGARWRSAVVAALFAMHPLHVESVAWVSERKDVLSGLFGLFALLAYGKGVAVQVSQEPVERTKGGKKQSNPLESDTARRASQWYLISVGAFALGLLCKPMLVTLPFVMLLLDYWPLNRIAGGGRQFVRLLMEKLPFFALSLGSSVITFVVQRKGGAVSPLESLPVPDRIGNALVSYVRYLAKTFWPDDLSILYPHPGHWPTGQVIAAAAVLVAVSVVAMVLRRRAPFVAVGWFWFLGMMVPVIGLVQVGIQSMADRYTYLPLIGIFVIVVWAAGVVAEWRVATRPIFATLAGVIVALCCLATSVQLRIWKNSETLFRHAVKVTANNYLAWNNLGFYFAAKNRDAEAKEAYRESLRINPNYADAHNNLGHALAVEKKYTEALEHYRIALRANPNNLEIHNNFGNAISELGDVDGAMAEYRFVLQRNPDHIDAHNNLGIALAMKGQLNEAIEHLNASLHLKPGNAGAHGNLGNAFAAQHKFDEAMKHYREALKLSPNDAQTRNNLANVLAELGRLDEAVTNYNMALQLNAENPEAHFNLGCVMVRLGQRAEAVSHFNEALRLKPDYTAAQEQLQKLAAETKP